MNLTLDWLDRGENQVWPRSRDAFSLSVSTLSKEGVLRASSTYYRETRGCIVLRRRPYRPVLGHKGAKSEGFA
jgi:hypothetical protein